VRILSPRTRALIGFAALGLSWGAFGAALPALQRRTGASDAELGVALVILALGALVSMRATGVLMDRFGPRVTPITAGAFALTSVLPGLAGSPRELSASLLLLGATSGAMDVAINADAVHDEIATGRQLLNLAHAFFSGGVVVSSVATGLLRAAGAEPPVIFALAAGIVLVCAWLMRTGGAQWQPPDDSEPSRFLQRVPAWLLVLGGLGALAYWIENAWQSWGAVHLERTLDAPPAVSALGPALFATAMTIGRLSAHRLAGPGTERRVLVAGAALAAAGSAIAAAAQAALLALAGIALAGAGCSVCAPTLVSIAGRAARPAERATIVGSITTVMYLGFLVGPAAVGGLAELATLRISLEAVAALALLLAVLFALVRFPSRGSG
jgi:MFS family permease